MVKPLLTYTKSSYMCDFPLCTSGLFVHPFGIFTFCNHRNLGIWSDVFSCLLLLIQNYRGFFLHKDFRVILSNFVESTIENFTEIALDLWIHLEDN